MNFFWVKVPVQVRTNGIAGLLIQEALDEFIGDIFGQDEGGEPGREKPAFVKEEESSSHDDEYREIDRGSTHRMTGQTIFIGLLHGPFLCTAGCLVRLAGHPAWLFSGCCVLPDIV